MLTTEKDGVRLAKYENELKDLTGVCIAHAP